MSTEKQLIGNITVHNTQIDTARERTKIFLYNCYYGVILFTTSMTIYLMLNQLLIE